MKSNQQKKTCSSSWFRQVPRRFFNFPLWGYSLYIGAGFGLAGGLHFRIWKQSMQVETIFTNFNIDVTRPTPTLALVLFIITGISAAIVFYLLFHRIRREAGILELVFWGTITSIVFAWIPWLYASSVVCTVFLFLYGMISLAGFGLAYRLRKYRNTGNTNRPDSWKMLVNAIKACAAVIAILLGAIATSVLVPWRNSIVEGFELLRYAFLCAHIVIGMILFILMPLLATCLENEPTDNVELEPPGPV